MVQRIDSKKCFSKLKLYVHKILGINIVISGETDVSSISFYLQEYFQLYNCKLYDNEYILLYYKSGNSLSPAKLRDYVDKLQGILEKKIIFITDVNSSYNRDRLIKHKVSFIIPDKQMFLPDIGIDLREFFQSKKEKVRYFTPSSQSIIIYLLLKKIKDRMTPRELMEISGYSKMTISRVIKELEVSEIIDIVFQGRNSVIILKQNGLKLWKSVLPYLKTPIKKTLYLKNYKKCSRKYFFKSGLTALSEYTMISEPEIPEYAIGLSEFNKLSKEKNCFELVKYPDDAEFILEIWNYSPNIIADIKKMIVDKLSLILCFKNTNDERVNQALENLIKEIKW